MNLFSAWSIPVRNSEIAVTVMGVLLAGAACFWREMLGLFGRLYRKFTDEARTIERSEHLRRVRLTQMPAPAR